MQTFVLFPSLFISLGRDVSVTRFIGIDYVHFINPNGWCFFGWAPISTEVLKEAGKGHSYKRNYLPRLRRVRPGMSSPPIRSPDRLAPRKRRRATSNRAEWQCYWRRQKTPVIRKHVEDFFLKFHFYWCTKFRISAYFWSFWALKFLIFLAKLRKSY